MNEERKARKRVRDQERYSTDPEYRARKRRQAKETRLRDPRRHTSTRMKRDYGITLDEHEALLAKQNGKCAICRTDDPGRGKRWNVDHCHTSGEIRGLLCVGCNFLLGHAKDNVEVLIAAAVYLEKAIMAGGTSSIKRVSGVRAPTPGVSPIPRSISPVGNRTLQPSITRAPRRPPHDGRSYSKNVPAGGMFDLPGEPAQE